VLSRTWRRSTEAGSRKGRAVVEAATVHAQILAVVVRRVPDALAGDAAGVGVCLDPLSRSAGAGIIARVEVAYRWREVAPAAVGRAVVAGDEWRIGKDDATWWGNRRVVHHQHPATDTGTAGARNRGGLAASAGVSLRRLFAAASDSRGQACGSQRDQCDLRNHSLTDSSRHRHRFYQYPQVGRSSSDFRSR